MIFGVILLFLYSVIIIIFLLSWISIPEYNVEEDLPELSITVIVPVRNEEHNISRLLQDLGNQKYTNFEVIFVDDSSTDNTKSIITSFPDKNFRVISNDRVQLGHKKNAITKAVNLSKSEVIVCTDGDCAVGVNWLKCINTFFRKSKLHLGSGPVTYHAQNSIFGRLQNIELASLIGSGASTIRLNIPTMCNGANIFYYRKTFCEVGGFSGNEDVASGDDEFLMHKIFKHTDGKVGFLKSTEAIVKTHSNKSLKQLISQRKRWSSKWKHYKLIYPKVLAPFIALVNLIVLFLALWSLFMRENVLIVIGVISIKYIVEYFYLTLVFRFLNQRLFKLFDFTLIFIMYPFYVLYFALNSWRKSYTWKERDIYV